MNQTEVLTKYESFRDRCQPNLYDFHYAFRPFHLVSCCSWGPVVHLNNCCARQQVYFGTRADENAIFNKSNNQKWIGGAASILAVAEVDLPQQGYQLEKTAQRSCLVAENGDGSNQENANNAKGSGCKLKVAKMLIHPGEINSFIPWHQNMKVVASHSDHKEVFIWDIEKQVCMQSKHCQEASSPNITL